MPSKNKKTKTTKRNLQLIKSCTCLLFKNSSYESTSLSSDKDIDRKDKNQHRSIHSSGLPEEPKGSNNKSENKNSKLEDPTKGSDGEPTTNPKPQHKCWGWRHFFTPYTSV